MSEEIKSVFNKIPDRLLEWVMIVLIAAMSGYATVLGTIKSVERIEPIVNQHEVQIQVLRNDIGYIKEGIDELRRRKH